ncbi:MAG: sigma-70 family RNA polymerase sigma factor [Myxococcota bacterium]|nr:sigma-70 family RNA polymerase sigma factor [Myxococcota bacterium]
MDTVPSLDDWEVRDLVQETYTQACAKQDQYDPERALEVTWLGGIARNVARAYQRDKKRGPELEFYSAGAEPGEYDSFRQYYDLPLREEDDLPAHDDSPEDVFSAIEQVEKALESLSPHQFLVGRMLLVDGNSPEEVADSLGITRRAVDLTAMRIRQKLSGG